MAYKVQYGNSFNSGSTLQRGLVTAKDSTVQGVEVSASTDIDAKGTLTIENGFLKLPRGAVTPAGYFRINENTREMRHQASVGALMGKFEIGKGDSGTAMVQLWGDSNKGILKMPAASPKIKVDDTQVSASSNVTIGSSGVTTYDLYVSGNVTVNDGSNVDVNVSDAFSKDTVFELAYASNNNACEAKGVYFGHSGNSGDDGGAVKYSAGAGNVCAFAEPAGNETLELSASYYIGSGADVSGILAATGVQNPVYSIQATVSGSEAAGNVSPANAQLKKGFNKVGIETDTANNMWAVYLPALGGGTTMKVGDTIRVKMTSSLATDQRYASIRPVGDKIDGEQMGAGVDASIKLSSPMAAAEFVVLKLGSGGQPGLWGLF